MKSRTMDVPNELNKYYKHKYGVDIPNFVEPVPKHVDTTLPNIQNLNLSELTYLKSVCEKYLEDVKSAMKLLDAYRSDVGENIEGIEYLLHWFDVWVENITARSRPEYDDEPDIIEELRKWFVKYADPKMFEYTEGSYIAKRSTYMNVFYTLWLKTQDLYCHCYEGDRNWSYKRIWSVETKSYIHSTDSSWHLSKMLKPLSEEEIFKRFELIDKNTADPQFLHEFTKFLHCEVLDVSIDWEEGPYVHLDQNCCEFNY